MKHQIVVINGGDSFETYEDYLKFLKDWQINFKDYRNGKKGWKSRLSEDLGPDFEVISPDMPNRIDAKYLEWKIWFEKFIPHLDQEVVLIGHSMGGTFLVKYLAENDFPKKVAATFLVAAPYYEKGPDYSLADFKLPENLEKFKKQAGRTFFYHSEDDPIVSLKDFEGYKQNLNDAMGRVFKNRGHFLNESFPELIEDLKSIF